jgi:hypothetical protein
VIGCLLLARTRLNKLNVTTTTTTTTNYNNNNNNNNNNNLQPVRIVTQMAPARQRLGKHGLKAGIITEAKVTLLGN